MVTSVLYRGTTLSLTYAMVIARDSDSSPLNCWVPLAKFIDQQNEKVIGQSQGDAVLLHMA